MIKSVILLEEFLQILLSVSLLSKLTCMMHDDDLQKYFWHEERFPNSYAVINETVF